MLERLDIEAERRRDRVDRLRVELLDDRRLARVVEAEDHDLHLALLLPQLPDDREEPHGAPGRPLKATARAAGPRRRRVGTLAGMADGAGAGTAIGAETRSAEGAAVRTVARRRGAQAGGRVAGSCGKKGMPANCRRCRQQIIGSKTRSLSLSRRGRRPSPPRCPRARGVLRLGLGFCAAGIQNVTLSRELFALTIRYIFVTYLLMSRSCPFDATPGRAVRGDRRPSVRRRAAPRVPRRRARARVRSARRFSPSRPMTTERLNSRQNIS